VEGRERKMMIRWLNEQYGKGKRKNKKMKVRWLK
jgi:hypothetical protein